MSNKLANVPVEMHRYKQWLGWRYENRDSAKPTKVPFNPITGRGASVVDPSHWCTFDQACKALEKGDFNGAGFVFTDQDEYAGIDLDNPYEKHADGSFKHENPELALKAQQRVFDIFNSYSERSPSGTGLHIICKGSVPNGRRRGGIEAYSSGRYFTMTGDVYRNVAIAERQELLTTLWTELGGKARVQTYGGDLKQKWPDNEIIERALNAVNGDKFKRLLAGEWQDEYPSQSEADQAFINFLSFYSSNYLQIVRLFRQSPLGQRKKAQRADYMEFTVNRGFDQMIPPIDFDGIKNQLEDALAKDKAKTGGNLLFVPDIVTSPGLYIPKSTIQMQPGRTQPVKRGEIPTTPRPPGLLGDMADFIYSAAPRPVWDIALLGAVGLMAGVCGRAYNFSGTGLNMYLLLLAPTGVGKEAMALGIEKLIAYVKQGVNNTTGHDVMPSVSEFIGPGEISSGQALQKYLTTNRSFVSVVGEFGLTMQRLASPRASSSEIVLKKMFLDLYNKSGYKSVLRKIVYSDKDKNTDDIASPAFTLLGESTPETYYSSLDEGLIADGLLPRFFCQEYRGLRPPLNKRHAHALPSNELIERLSDLCDSSLKLNSVHEVVNVQQTTNAEIALDRVNDVSDNNINSPDQNEILRQLWSRAHVKVFKLAALVAVGVKTNDGVPLIRKSYVDWAFELIKRDITNISNRFESGEVGRNSEETKQATDVIRIITQFIKYTYEDVSKYRVDRKMHFDKTVPISYIQRRLVAAAAFRNDRIGATNAIKRTIQSLIDDGDLQEIGKTELATKYNKTGRAFVISNPHRFL